MGLYNFQGQGMLGEMWKEDLEQVTSVSLSESLWKAYSSTLTPQQDNLLNTRVIFY